MDIRKYMTDSSEKPLDRISDDGGFTGIFNTIACIGDSLSSGEWQTRNKDGSWTYTDVFWYSWGQYISRMTGTKVYNFSRGGMTAAEYMQSFADEKDYWNPIFKSQAYIIALGANDITRVINGSLAMGSVTDIGEQYTENAESFTGYYAAIIQRYKIIAPDAKFFLMTQPHDESVSDRDRLQDEHQKLLYDIANMFSNTYVLDFRKYAPVYDQEFKKNFYLNGHMSPSGYLLTAKMTASYIDYIIRKYPEDFLEVGLINTELINHKE